MTTISPVILNIIGLIKINRDRGQSTDRQTTDRSLTDGNGRPIFPTQEVMKRQQKASHSSQIKGGNVF